ncbi:MAG: twin-arginine translocase TatA/TatE family subunit [Polyangiaceae bacterium]|nr:twin-arginine translocase TatA/TatE family subunit [Polyangiaceae bacterium]
MAIGPLQIVLVLLVILLLFGASRLSEIGKGLGEGIRNFKKGLSDDDAIAGKTPKKKLKGAKKKSKKAEEAEFEDEDEDGDDADEDEKES